jgi:hypothetical protein
MSLPAIVMLVFGLGITWGGAAACIFQAVKKK